MTMDEETGEETGEAAGEAAGGARGEGVVALSHGDGGLMTRRLVNDVFLRLGGKVLGRLDDAAVLDVAADLAGGRLACTTDSFVVDPIFFPGGDIGRLAVCGTVNDLAVSGAVPRFLAASFILEEGLAIAALQQVVDSMVRAAAEAKVEVVAGDPKVVERGHGDKVFITTTGIGFVPAKVELGAELIQPGDAVLINGAIGEHGLAVLSARPGLAFKTAVKSDCAPLADLVARVLAAAPVRFMRDPTRGGVATTLGEAALSAGVDIVLDEERLPLTPAVVGGAEMLGLDPLYLANEGKAVFVVPEAAAAAALAALRGHGLGRAAGVIGRVEKRSGDEGRLFLRTALGSRRRLPLLSGEQLPRIC